MKSEKQILEKLEELKKRKLKLDPEDGMEFAEYLKVKSKIGILGWVLDGMSENV